MTSSNTPDTGEQPAPVDPQAAFAGMDPQQFQALMMQAMANFSTRLGTLGSHLKDFGASTLYRSDLLGTGELAPSRRAR